jgi:hypothetical protein
MSTTFNFVLDEKGNVKVADEGTPAEENATPTAGDIRFNSEKSKIEFYNGFVWIPVISSSEIKKIYDEVEETVGQSTQKETFGARFDAVADEMSLQYKPESEVQTINRRFAEQVNLLFNQRVQELLEHMVKYQEALDAIMGGMAPLPPYNSDDQLAFDESILSPSFTEAIAELLDELDDGHYGPATQPTGSQPLDPFDFTESSEENSEESEPSSES